MAIDEFQQISEYEPQAEAIFRTWVQEIPEVRFIFSGSHRSMMEAMFTETKRPFYQSSQLEALNPIDLVKYTDFIRDHFLKAKKEITDSSISKIYELSRGQTYTIQLLCNRLYSTYQRISETEVHLIFQQILDQQKVIYANFQKSLPELNGMCSKQLPKRNPCSTHSLRNLLQNMT